VAKKCQIQLVIQLDPEGKIKYDTQHGPQEEKVIYSKYNDLDPREVIYVDDSDLHCLYEETSEEITEKTRVALQKIVSRKVAAAMPSHQGGIFNS